jgi:hypothetical protein
MNIIHGESGSKLNKLKKQKNLISFIVDKVFTICREDENFSTENATKIENKLHVLNEKLEKQKSLLNQSKSIEEDLTEKITKLDSESFSLKVNVLEKLGSEL